MSVLTGDSIETLGIITPFEQRFSKTEFSYGKSFCGYDIRVDQDVVLTAKKFSLASSLEHINMPNDCVGFLKDKSSRIRKGLFVAQGVLEPNWRGHITLELFNASDATMHVRQGEGIAQILFCRLESPLEKGYDGKYQDQARGPQQAK